MILLGERLSSKFWIGSLVALVGVYFISVNNQNGPSNISIGDLLALCSGVFYAIYILLNRQGRQKLDSLTYLWLSNFTSAAILLVVAYLNHYQFWGYSLKAYLVLFTLGILSQVVGFWLVVYAQGLVSASSTALILLLEPVATLLFAGLLLSEWPTLRQFLGMLIVLGGIFLAQKKRGFAEN